MTTDRRSHQLDVSIIQRFLFGYQMTQQSLQADLPHVGDVADLLDRAKTILTSRQSAESQRAQLVTHLMSKVSDLTMDIARLVGERDRALQTATTEQERADILATQLDTLGVEHDQLKTFFEALINTEAKRVEAILEEDRQIEAKVRHRDVAARFSPTADIVQVGAPSAEMNLPAGDEEFEAAFSALDGAAPTAIAPEVAPAVRIPQTQAMLKSEVPAFLRGGPAVDPMIAEERVGLSRAREALSSIIPRKSTHARV